MSLSHFSTIPAWLSKPSQLINVINNPFSSLQDIPTFTHLQDSTRFSSGLRQALFWRKQLSPSASSHTVIFSLLGSHGLCLPNVLEVCQALKSICNTLLITEIYRASNSNFIGISFSSHHEASKIRHHFTYFKESIVIHVPSSSAAIHNFKLLWLPPLFPDSRINHFLTKHSAFHQFSRDSTLTDTNLLSPTNSVSGTLRLHPNTDVNLLPHLIPLPAPHLGHALFIVSGRPSYCLRCGLTGHVRRSCLVPRCSLCHRYHHTSSACSSHPLPSESSLIDLWNDDMSLNEADSTPITTPDTSHHIFISDNPSSGYPSSFNQCESPALMSHHSLMMPPSTLNNNIHLLSSVPKCDRTFADALKNDPSASPNFHPSAFTATITSPANLETKLSPLTLPSTTSDFTALPSPIANSLSVPTLMDCSSSDSSTTIIDCPIDNTSPHSALVVDHPPSSQHSSHSSSSFKHSRKRHKRHSSNSSSTSTHSATISDTAELPITSWADQVEENSSLHIPSPIIDDYISSDPPHLPPSSDTSQATTSDSPSTDSIVIAVTSTLSSHRSIVQTNTSKPTFVEHSNNSLKVPSTPPRLIFIAAKAITSHNLHVQPDVFLPSFTLDNSSAFIACTCGTHFHSKWPIKTSVSCPRCSQILTFQRSKHFFLLPNLPFICLMLSPADHTDPISIEYLLTSLRLGVPIVPYICYPKPRTRAYFASLDPPPIYTN